MAERAPRFLVPPPPPPPPQLSLSSSSSSSIPEPPSNPMKSDTTINMTIQKIPPPPQQQQQQQLIPTFEPGTYIVQVPRNQIYRVPPPQNALFNQHYGNPDHKKRNRLSSCCCCCCSPLLCCSIIIGIVIVIVAIIIAVSFITLKPKNPEFQLEKLVVMNRTSHLEYDVSLGVHNQNKRSGVSYKREGASSVLSFKKHKLAFGKFPSFQQGNGDTTTGVSLVLKEDNGSSLPKEIKESIKGGGKLKVQVLLTLVMNVPVRMKTSSFKTSDDTMLIVTCDFMVDTLAKGIKILSQECNTENIGNVYHARAL